MFNIKVVYQCLLISFNGLSEQTLSLSLSLSVVTHGPFHASVLRPTSWPNARDCRDGEVN